MKFFLSLLAIVGLATSTISITPRKCCGVTLGVMDYNSVVFDSNSTYTIVSTNPDFQNCTYSSEFAGNMIGSTYKANQYIPDLDLIRIHDNTSGKDARLFVFVHYGANPPVIKSVPFADIEGLMKQPSDTWYGVGPKLTTHPITPMEFDFEDPVIINWNNMELRAYSIPVIDEQGYEEDGFYVLEAPSTLALPWQQPAKAKTGPFNDPPSGVCTDGAKKIVTSTSYMKMTTGPWTQLGETRAEVSGSTEGILKKIGVEVKAGVVVASNLMFSDVSYLKYWYLDIYVCRNRHWVYDHSERCEARAKGIFFIPSWWRIIAGYPAGGQPQAWTIPACEKTNK